MEWWNVQMTTLYRYFLLIAHALYDKTTLKWLRKFSEQLLLLLLELAPLTYFVVRKLGFLPMIIEIGYATLIIVHLTL